MNMNRENHGDVGQQRQRQPLQVANVGLVAQIHLQDQAQHAEAHAIQMRGAAQQQPQRLAHRRNIRRDVDGVGDQQETDDAVQHRPRKHRLHIRGQALARDEPETRADHLDAHHQRVGEQHRPQHAVAELRAGLGIGRNAARIVVGRARDEARSQLLDPRIVCEAFEQFNHRRSPRRHDSRLMRTHERIEAAQPKPSLQSNRSMMMWKSSRALHRQDDANGEP